MRRYFVPGLSDEGEGGDVILSRQGIEKHVFGLIGADVSRSMSPRIHTIAMERAGIEGVYRTFPLEEAGLPDFMRRMKLSTPAGINVTIPFKETVMPFLDELSLEAGEIGAVNTVGKDEGRLIGYNTDCMGFLRSLEDAGIDPSGKKAMVIGSGGAARAITYGLVTGGVSSLTVTSRNTRSAREIAGLRDVGFPRIDRRFLDLSNDPTEEEFEKADIIINATPLGSGAFPDSSPLSEDCPLHAGQVVVDIVYEPESTPLLRYAESRGATTMNGLRMLVHQALGSLRIWLGVDIDAEFVLNRL